MAVRLYTWQLFMVSAIFRTQILANIQFESKIHLNFTGAESVVRMLLENGIDINAKNEFGNSALILAISSGEILNLLNGYSIQETSKGSISSCLGFEKFAELLIEKGADINIVGFNGETGWCCVSS